MVTTKSRWTRYQSKPQCSKQHQVSGRRINPNLDPLLLAPPSKNRDPDQSAVYADVRGQLKRYTPEFPDLKLRGIRVRLTYHTRPPSWSE